MAFLALVCVCLVAIFAITCAIIYFLQIGFFRALGYALIAMGAFLVFLASGLWDGASNHSWGPLAFAFAFMLVGGFLCLKFGNKAWLWWKKRH